MNDLIVTDRQKCSLLQGIEEGVLQPGISAILTIQISLLQDGKHIIITNYLYRHTGYSN